MLDSETWKSRKWIIITSSHGLAFLMLTACLNTDLCKDLHKTHHECKMWLTACIRQYLHALTIFILVSLFFFQSVGRTSEVLDNVDFIPLRKSLKNVLKKRKNWIFGTESCQDWALWGNNCNHQKWIKKILKLSVTSQDGDDGVKICAKLYIVAAAVHSCTSFLHKMYLC